MTLTCHTLAHHRSFRPTEAGFPAIQVCPTFPSNLSSTLHTLRFSVLDPLWYAAVGRGTNHRHCFQPYWVSKEGVVGVGVVAVVVEDVATVVAAVEATAALLAEEPLPLMSLVPETSPS